MSVSQLCWIHRGFMSLSCHFQPNRAPNSFMALSLKLLSDNLELWEKVPWKWHEYDLFEHDKFEAVESAMKVPWICHESVMKLFGGPCSGLKWKWHESDMKVPWKRHESAMKVAWVWYEYDMNMLQWISTIFHGRFIALSFNSKIVEIHYIIFISDSCQIHATFMALSWHFHGSLKNFTPNTFTPFPWHFLWTLWQNSDLSFFVSVCLSVVSVFFSSSDIFIDGLSGWSIFLWFFFDQNIGL